MLVRPERTGLDYQSMLLDESHLGLQRSGLEPERDAVAHDEPRLAGVVDELHLGLPITEKTDLHPGPGEEPPLHG